jgi:hypothetical protein
MNPARSNASKIFKLFKIKHHIKIASQTGIITSNNTPIGELVTTSTNHLYKDLLTRKETSLVSFANNPTIDITILQNLIVKSIADNNKMRSLI